MSTHNISLYYALLGGRTICIDEGTTGYWSPSTAPINWCELDYEVSHYIAEFWNTITNLAYIGTGFYAFILAKHLSWHVQLAAISCIFTGIFSGIFHATLYLQHQRLDEVFENGILIFLTHHTYRNPSISPALGHFVLVSIGILFVETFRFCEIHLACIILFTIHRFKILAANSSPAGLSLKYAALCTITGFGCWIIDRIYCQYVSPQYGLLPFNLQLHAWWHLWTALALYYGFRTLLLVEIDKKSV